MKIKNVGDLGKLVREKRRQLGLTQQAAAGLMGVGTRFLSELERGKETLEVGKVLRIVNGIGLNVHVTGGSHES